MSIKFDLILRPGLQGKPFKLGQIPPDSGFLRPVEDSIPSPLIVLVLKRGTWISRAYESPPE